MISLFHAQGNIWPELGEPIIDVPQVYEFAVYCDFPSAPQIRIDAPPELLERKLAGIQAYVSQEQIEAVVQIQRDIGAVEYLRELNFDPLLAGVVSRGVRQMTCVRKGEQKRGTDILVCRVFDLNQTQRTDRNVYPPVTKMSVPLRINRQTAMIPKICYLGDDSLTGAAAYLGGIMRHFGMPFDYVASDRSPPAAFCTEAYAAYVVSDYPATRWNADQMAFVAEAVRQGSGLAMFGGWESFFGRLGEYHRSPLADVLPVVMEEEDDRRNCAQPCLLKKVAEHPILDGLPWDQPPGIGGFNAVMPKPDATTLLEGVRFSVRSSGGVFSFQPLNSVPLLVVGQHGRGRTVALATDVAPHWVGGMVDWGDARITQDIGEGFVEIGNWYAMFFRNLLAWVMGAS